MEKGSGESGEKVVARFRDGSMLKGYMSGFSIEADSVILDEQDTHEQHRVMINYLKAIYFVKTFKGVSKHIERKAFGIRTCSGRKVFIRFSDHESLVGFVEGEVPWEKGFSLAKLGKKVKGFFLIPADGDSNNERVFVVGSAIQEITIMV